MGKWWKNHEKWWKGFGLEVKELGGDYNEAVIQFGIWCSAGL